MPERPATQIGLGKLAAGPGNLGLHARPVREPGPGEALVEVLAAGICGTDLHIEDDEFPSAPPVTMGHEVSGDVVALGADVATTWLGARVALETYFHYCGVCRHCRAGYPNLCGERLSIGSKVDGGFARWITIPARNLHRLPETVGPHAGALAEPLACVAECLYDPVAILPGDRVLVVGPGTMGLLTAQVAAAAGGQVTVAGLPRDRDRLAIAASLGFATYESGPDQSGLAGPFEAVCECSGAAAAAGMALDAVAKRGRYVQVGIFGGPIQFDVDTILYKELVVTSGNASTPASWDRAMELLEAGSVQLDPLVTKAVPLTEWQQAFRAVRSGEGLKYVLDPRTGD